MQTFSVNAEVRWADLDPNFHMLHSRYYDLGAHCRMTFFVTNGLTPAVLQAHEVGPIIFAERCEFKRELVFGDQPTINMLLTRAREDYSRWTIRHEIWKNADTLAAIIECSGAWMNTKARKLAAPSKEILQCFDHAPRSEDFVLDTTG